MEQTGLFRILQKYKFESKSQLKSRNIQTPSGCLGYYKNTNLKANHNYPKRSSLAHVLFRILQKYKFESKSQLPCWWATVTMGCLGYYQNTDLGLNCVFNGGSGCGWCSRRGGRWQIRWLAGRRSRLSCRKIWILVSSCPCLWHRTMAMMPGLHLMSGMYWL